MARQYRLSADGDSLEQRAWRDFVATDWPSYEAYWIRSVVPLTKRPVGIVFRPKVELDAMGKSDEDVCLAHLNYTVLYHLAVAYGLRNSPVSHDNFVHAIVRLSSAGDVAHEFLGRTAKPGSYDPWSEEQGTQARRDWRRNHRDLEDLHDYRNRLLHGRLPMGIVGPVGLMMPRLGQAIDLD